MNNIAKLVGVAFLFAMGAAQADFLRVPPVVAKSAVNTVVATHSVLKVCAHGAGCPPGMGGWLDAVSIGPDGRDMPREFLWKTEAGKLGGWRWQVSGEPFASGDADTPGVLAEGDAGSPQAGRFSIRFNALPETSSPPAEKQSGHFKLKKPEVAAAKLLLPRYYVRVLPMAEGRAIGTASNAVRVEFVQAQPPAPNPVARMPDQVYSVRVVDFERPRPATLPWGCVNITAVDFSKSSPLNRAGYALYDSHRKQGKPVCPEVYRGVGEKPWYESLWDFASSGVDWASGVYTDLKSYAVKIAASAINALPGNLCNPKCEQGLTMGLNAGLVALGVPPNLPSLEALSDQGMAYLVETAASQAGIPCDAACQEGIGSGIKAMVKEAAGRTVAAYCGDVETAHRNGRETLCLPPGVAAQPAPGSANQPGKVVLRITRNPGTEAISAASAATFKLRVDFQAVNQAGVDGSWGVPTNTCYTDNSVFPCDVEIIKTHEPLRGALFKPLNADLPTLSPGRSFETAFFLEPAVYWLPGHKEAIKKKGGHVKYNDWWKLYRGAELNVVADIHCPKAFGAPTGSCTQADRRGYAIPATGN